MASIRGWSTVVHWKTARSFPPAGSLLLSCPTRPWNPPQGGHTGSAPWMDVFLIQGSNPPGSADRM